MKKIIILSIVAAAVLFTGCDSKESATDTATKAVESTKEAAGHAVNATKEATGKAVDAVEEAASEAAEKTVEVSKKAVDATKEAASQAADSAKEGVATATVAVATAVADSATHIAGEAAYVKCKACHGADGKTIALGKSPAIAGQTKEELITKLNEYKAGTRNVSGMGALMKSQVDSMDDAAIEAVSIYISTLK